MASKILIILVLALAGLALIVLVRAQRHEAAAQAAYPPIGRFVDVGGVPVHAVVMGAGPDLVLIHGASGNLRDMTFGLAPRLAERYRVFVFDRPGLGYTPRLHRAGASLAEQADLLHAAAEKLGARRPIVVGQSYGGAVALSWALRHPDAISALVPVAAASHPWRGGVSTFYRLTASRLGATFLVPVITAFASDERVERAIESIFAPQAEPEGYADHVGAGLTLRRQTLIANARQRTNLLEEIRAQVADYPRIDVPVEIVHGTADTTVGLEIHSEPLAHAIPGANLVRLPGVGHMPHHVAQDEVVAAIDRAAERAGLRPPAERPI